MTSTISSVTLRVSQLNVGSYTIAWNSSVSNGSKTGVKKTSTTINGLVSNTAYSITATAINSAGVGQQSNPMTFFTGLFL